MLLQNILNTRGSYRLPLGNSLNATIHSNGRAHLFFSAFLERSWRVLFYSALKRNETVPFAETWMDLDTVIQGEVSQKEKNKYHMCVLSRFSHVWLFATPWTVAHQVPLSMGIIQARLLGWIAMPSSWGSSQPRDWTCFSMAHALWGDSLSHQGSPKNPILMHICGL